MSDTQIDFSVPATLRKWPSVNKERVSAGLGARPYTIIAGTLDEASGSLCPSRYRSIIYMKFTPRHSLIWLARYYRRIASLSWSGSGIFSE
jgi:uncharacterized coiled-coil protein SlyX